MKRFLLAAILFFAALVQAQTFPLPGKPVRIIVPFPPGGQTDVQARALALKLSESLGVPVVVDNRPGGSTIPGAMEVVKAAPDGHTLLYTISITTAQNPHLFAKLPYDAFKDLTPLMLTGRNSLVVTANVHAPFNTMPELIEFARRHPGQLNYASFSAGSTSHLAAEMLKQKFGIDIVHVPFKGSADANMALMGGEVHMMFDGPTPAITAARTGKVKLLAYADDKRNPALPQVPTFPESGITGFDLSGGMHMYGPGGMTPELARKVNTALAAAMRDPDIVKMFVEGGLEVAATSPHEHARLVREWYERWGAVIRRLGLKLD